MKTKMKLYWKKFIEIPCADIILMCGILLLVAVFVRIITGA